MVKRLYRVIPIGGFFLFLSCAGGSLQGYKPGSPEEETIKTLLLAYEEAWNNQDKRGLIILLHDDFVIRVGKKRIIIFSKNTYAFQIRDIWLRYRYLSFGTPKIWKNNDRASVHLSMSIDGRVITSMFRLIREDDEWLILEWQL